MCIPAVLGRRSNLVGQAISTYRGTLLAGLRFGSGNRFSGHPPCRPTLIAPHHMSQYPQMFHLHIDRVSKRTESSPRTRFTSRASSRSACAVLRRQSSDGDRNKRAGPRRFDVPEIGSARRLELVNRHLRQGSTRQSGLRNRHQRSSRYVSRWPQLPSPPQ